MSEFVDVGPFDKIGTPHSIKRVLIEPDCYRSPFFSKYRVANLIFEGRETNHGGGVQLTDDELDHTSIIMKFVCNQMMKLDNPNATNVDLSRILCGLKIVYSINNEHAQNCGQVVPFSNFGGIRKFKTFSISTSRRPWR